MSSERDTTSPSAVASNGIAVDNTSDNAAAMPPSLLRRLLALFLHNRLLAVIVAVVVLLFGFSVAPFRWPWRPAGIKPVAVDALPNLGDNQQVVYTDWPGQSPEDIDQQITYPLTTAMLGTRGVKSVRSSSMFGSSSIYVIFDDSVDFYQSRSLISEKLQSLGGDVLPAGVTPRLGPESTGLGQVYWYTLEGRDEDGQSVGGWDLHELRTIQDWYVRYALAAVAGVSEVASVGGYVRQFQVDLDREAMSQYGLSMKQIYTAISASNFDTSAKTIELNNIEYFVRGTGFVKSVDQLAGLIVAASDTTPIYLRQVADISLGPAPRRGILNKNGVEAVGGVVTVRYDANAMTTIENVRRAVDRLAGELDRRAFIDFALAARHGVSADDIKNFAAARGFEAFDSAGRPNHRQWLSYIDSTDGDQRPAWLKSSRVTIVPYYDRTGLIDQTLATLSQALGSQMLITFIVIILMMANLRSSLIIGALLPMAVGLTFIVMRIVGVEANIVALAGIAIAIGTIVDMGIVLCDNILQHLAEGASESAASEAAEANNAGAAAAAGDLSAASGDIKKLSAARRLQLVLNASNEVGSAVLTAVLTTVVGFLPVFALTGRSGRMFTPLAFTKTFALGASIVIALLVLPTLCYWLLRPAHKTNGNGGSGCEKRGVMKNFGRTARWICYAATIAAVGYLLVSSWMPVGRDASLSANLLFSAIIIAVLIGSFKLFQYFYPAILRWALAHKKTFICAPLTLIVVAMMAWLGSGKTVGALLNVAGLGSSRAAYALDKNFPAMGREFMPDFDEGSFLWMPTISINASVAEAREYLRMQNMAMMTIPEITSVVGKAGRTDSALDPAPLSMIETVINYKPKYAMIDGEWTRQWRYDIETPDDIWDEIVRAAKVTGSTSASKGYPIQIRQVMLQTGMTANMGVKLRGEDLADLTAAADAFANVLADCPDVVGDSINVDRVTGKPYLVLDTADESTRRNMQLYGVNSGDILRAMRDYIGGRVMSTSVDGRQRIDIRVRYQRELRDTIEAISQIRVTGVTGRSVPLANIASFKFVRGPQVVKSEDTFKVAYVTFDTTGDKPEVDAAAAIDKYLAASIKEGRLHLPDKTGYTLSGTFESEAQANATLAVVVPLSLAAIFIILYFQFRSIVTTAIIFSGVAVAFSGGFIMLWLYGQSWFAGGSLAGLSLREIFNIQTVNLSTAVWVGFLALFGIATDDGVVMGTYLTQLFREGPPATLEECRKLTVIAGSRRVRACLMTTATTILALLPVLSSTGKGSDIMVAMAIPSFGGMAIEVLTMLVVPVLFCWVAELKLTHGKSNN